MSEREYREASWSCERNGHNLDPQDEYICLTCTRNAPVDLNGSEDDLNITSSTKLCNCCNGGDDVQPTPEERLADVCQRARDWLAESRRGIRPGGNETLEEQLIGSLLEEVKTLESQLETSRDISEQTRKLLVQKNRTVHEYEARDRMTKSDEHN